MLQPCHHTFPVQKTESCETRETRGTERGEYIKIFEYWPLQAENMEINEQYGERLDAQWLKSRKIGCKACVKRKTIQWLELLHSLDMCIGRILFGPIGDRLQQYLRLVKHLSVLEVLIWHLHLGPARLLALVRF